MEVETEQQQSAKPQSPAASTDYTTPDLGRNALFALFSRKKEKVHQTLRLKRQLYDLTKDNFRSHYSTNGYQIHPWLSELQETTPTSNTDPNQLNSPKDPLSSPTSEDETRDQNDIFISVDNDNDREVLLPHSPNRHHHQNNENYIDNQFSSQPQHPHNDHLPHRNPSNCDEHAHHLHKQASNEDSRNSHPSKTRHDPNNPTQDTPVDDEEARIQTFRAIRDQKLHIPAPTNNKIHKSSRPNGFPDAMLPVSNAQTRKIIYNRARAALESAQQLRGCKASPLLQNLTSGSELRCQGQPGDPTTLTTNRESSLDLMRAIRTHLRQNAKLSEQTVYVPRHHANTQHRALFDVFRDTNQPQDSPKSTTPRQPSSFRFPRLSSQTSGNLSLLPTPQRTHSSKKTKVKKKGQSTPRNTTTQSSHPQSPPTDRTSTTSIEPRPGDIADIASSPIILPDLSTNLSTTNITQTTSISAPQSHHHDDEHKNSHVLPPNNNSDHHINAIINLAATSPNEPSSSMILPHESIPQSIPQPSLQISHSYDSGRSSLSNLQPQTTNITLSHSGHSPSNLYFSPSSRFARPVIDLYGHSPSFLPSDPVHAPSPTDLDLTLSNPKAQPQSTSPQGPQLDLSEIVLPLQPKPAQLPKHSLLTLFRAPSVVTTTPSIHSLSSTNYNPDSAPKQQSSNSTLSALNLIVPPPHSSRPTPSTSSSHYLRQTAFNDSLAQEITKLPHLTFTPSELNLLKRQIQQTKLTRLSTQPQSTPLTSPTNRTRTSRTQSTTSIAQPSTANKIQPNPTSHPLPTPLSNIDDIDDDTPIAYTRPVGQQLDPRKSPAPSQTGQTSQTAIKLRHRYHHHGKHRHYKRKRIGLTDLFDIANASNNQSHLQTSCEDPQVSLPTGTVPTTRQPASSINILPFEDVSAVVLHAQQLNHANELDNQRDMLNQPLKPAVRKHLRKHRHHFSQVHSRHGHRLHYFKRHHRTKQHEHVHLYPDQVVTADIEAQWENEYESLMYTTGSSYSATSSSYSWSSFDSDDSRHRNNSNNHSNNHSNTPSYLPSPKHIISPTNSSFPQHRFARASTLTLDQPLNISLQTGCNDVPIPIPTPHHQHVFHRRGSLHHHQQQQRQQQQVDLYDNHIDPNNKTPSLNLTTSHHQPLSRNSHLLSPSNVQTNSQLTQISSTIPDHRSNHGSLHLHSKRHSAQHAKELAQARKMLENCQDVFGDREQRDKGTPASAPIPTNITEAIANHNRARNAFSFHNQSVTAPSTNNLSTPSSNELTPNTLTIPSVSGQPAQKEKEMKPSHTFNIRKSIHHSHSQGLLSPTGSRFHQSLTLALPTFLDSSQQHQLQHRPSSEHPAIPPSSPRHHQSAHLPGLLEDQNTPKQCRKSHNSPQDGHIVPSNLLIPAQNPRIQHSDHNARTPRPDFQSDHPQTEDFHNQTNTGGKSRAARSATITLGISIDPLREDNFKPSRRVHWAEPDSPSNCAVTTGENVSPHNPNKTNDNSNPHTTAPSSIKSVLSSPPSRVASLSPSQVELPTPRSLSPQVSSRGSIAANITTGTNATHHESTSSSTQPGLSFHIAPELLLAAGEPVSEPNTQQPNQYLLPTAQRLGFETMGNTAWIDIKALSELTVQSMVAHIARTILMDVSVDFPVGLLYETALKSDNAFVALQPAEQNPPHNRRLLSRDGFDTQMTLMIDDIRAAYPSRAYILDDITSKARHIINRLLDFSEYVEYVDMIEHKLSLDSLFLFYQTTAEFGLQSHQAEEYLEEAGFNEYPIPTENWVVWQWFKYVFLGFASIFWCFNVLGGLAYGLTDSFTSAQVIYDYSFICGIVLGLGSLSFGLHWKFSSVVKVPADIIPEHSTVLRDGKQRVIPSRELVPGDVIIFSEGEKIPADIRVIDASNLTISTAPISGDDTPILKSPLWTDDNVFYTQNWIFQGSIVLSGSGRGLVCKTGMFTTVGESIPNILKDPQEEEREAKADLKKEKSDAAARKKVQEQRKEQSQTTMLHESSNDVDPESGFSNLNSHLESSTSHHHNQGPKKIKNKDIDSEYSNPYDQTLHPTKLKEGRPKRKTMMDEVQFFFFGSTILSLVCWVTFVTYGLQFWSFWWSTINSYTVAFSNAPEGLLIAICISVLLGLRKLKQRKVIVKSPAAVETLSVLTDIILDKSGTITDNKPSLGAMLLANNEVDFLDVSELPPFRHAVQLSTPAHKIIPSNLGLHIIDQQLSALPTLVGLMYRINEVSPASIDETAANLHDPPRPSSPFHTQGSNSVEIGPNNVRNRSAGSKLFEDAGIELAPITTVREESENELNPTAEDPQIDLNAAIPAYITPYDWFVFATAISASLASQNRIDTAISNWAQQVCDCGFVLASNPCVLTVPFNPRDKVSLSIHKHPNGSFFGVIKGSVEKVLETCTMMMNTSTPQFSTSGTEFQQDQPHTFHHTLLPLDTDAVLRRYLKCCYSSQQVIAMAMTFFDPVEYPPNHVWSYFPPTFTLSGSIFLGMVGLDDKVTDLETPIRLLHESHIRTIFCSGASPLTLLTLARKSGAIPQDAMTLGEYAYMHKIPVHQIGRKFPHESSGAAFMRTRKPHNIPINTIALRGEDLLHFDLSQWNELLLSYQHIVVGHILPQQKVDLVLHLQRLHRVVAVAGSGKQDVQSMRQADVGLAHLDRVTNSDGTSTPSPKALQEVASVLILENTLDIVAQAVLTSRENVDNCRKAIGYTTMKLLPELMMSTFFQNMFNIPSPTTTMILVLIDTFIDLLPTLSLIFEPLEEKQRKAPPLKLHEEHIVGWRTVLISYLLLGVIQTAACFSTYLVGYTVFYGIHFSELWLKAHFYFGADATDDNGDVLVNELFLGKTLDERTAIWHQIKALVFICFSVQQICVSFSRRFRTDSMFKNGILGVFDNWRLTVSVCLSLLFCALIVYVDPIASFFSMRTPQGLLLNVWAWLFPVASAVVQIAFSEFRKAMIRSHGPESLWYKLFDY